MGSAPLASRHSAARRWPPEQACQKACDSRSGDECSPRSFERWSSRPSAAACHGSSTLAPRATRSRATSQHPYPTALASGVPIDPRASSRRRRVPRPVGDHMQRGPGLVPSPKWCGRDERVVGQELAKPGNVTAVDGCDNRASDVGRLVHHPPTYRRPIRRWVTRVNLSSALRHDGPHVAPPFAASASGSRRP